MERLIITSTQFAKDAGWSARAKAHWAVEDSRERASTKEAWPYMPSVGSRINKGVFEPQFGEEHLNYACEEHYERAQMSALSFGLLDLR